MRREKSKSALLVKNDSETALSHLCSGFGEFCRVIPTDIEPSTVLWTAAPFIVKSNEIYKIDNVIGAREVYGLRFEHIHVLLEPPLHYKRLAFYRTTVTKVDN